MEFQKNEFDTVEFFEHKFSTWQGKKVNGDLSYLDSIQEEIFGSMNIVEMITDGKNQYAVLGL